jgi:hypothetical protein
MLFADGLKLPRAVALESGVQLSSRKVQDRVQSSMITTAVCGRANCGCKCGTRAGYEGTDDGTVYTDKWARMCVTCDA